MKYTRHALQGAEITLIPTDSQLVEVVNFELGGLRFWVHGRQFPEVVDGGHDDWLRVAARYETTGASVWTTGAIVTTAAVHSFLRELKAMDKDLRGTAAVEPLEPYFSVSLEMQKNGAINFLVQITPDHMTQRHHFESKIDQTYLPIAIRGLQRVVESFPIT